MLLPILGEKCPTHICSEVLTIFLNARPDLLDQPLVNVDEVWFTDGSSYITERKRKCGYALVSLHEITEAWALPQGSSTQLAELIALTRVLELAKGKRVTIYTDFKYAFLILYAHAANWKERGYLTSKAALLNTALRLISYSGPSTCLQR